MSCCRLCCSQVPVSALDLRMSNSVFSTSVLDTASVCSTPLNLLMLSSACCPSLQQTHNTSLLAAGCQAHPFCTLQAAQHHLQPATWPADTSPHPRDSCADYIIQSRKDSLAASLQGQLVDSAIPLPLPSLCGGWRRSAIKVLDVIHVALIRVHVLTKQAPAFRH